MANCNLPDVVAILLCEAAAYDLNSDPWVLVRPLYKLRDTGPADFPIELRQSAIYFQMIDAFGEFRFHVVIRNIEREGSLGFLLRSPQFQLEFPDNRAIMEDVIHLSTINFLEEGEYQFQLFANGVSLGSSGAVYLNVRRA